MSNIEKDEDLPTEEEVLVWMRKKSRTFEWDAAVMYDRYRANLLLMQQYIARYEKEESFFEPLTGMMVVEGGRHWEYVHDVVLDAPRLSFERSVLGQARANLALHIVGGSHLTVKQPDNDIRRVTKVEAYDPLLGPKVVAEINFDDAIGTVTEDGDVKLDISKNTSIKLLIDTTSKIQSAGGDFFQSIFDAWEDDKKVFVLNTISQYGDDAILNPEKFRVRTLPAPGTKRRGSGRFGDGAILVFVASIGSEVGRLPDAEEQWVYPIPRGYSSTLMVNGGYALKRIIEEGLLTSTENAKLEIIGGSDPLNPVIGVQAVAGLMRAGNYWLVHHGNFSLVFVEAVVPMTDDPLYGKGSFKAFVEQDGVRIVWTADSSTGSYATRLYQQAPSGESTVDLTWACESTASPQIDHHGELRFVYKNWWESCKITPRGQLHPVHEGWWEFLLSGLEPEGRRKLFGVTADVLWEFKRVNLLSIHGILFRGDQAVVNRRASMPNDLVVFGDIAPNVTSFAIEPLEMIVGAGTTAQFKTVPARQDVTWKVDPVPGFAGKLGSVSAEGSYSAPKESEVDGSFTMVRVTATSEGKSSSALARVVLKSVVVNPLIATSSFTAGAHKVTGAGLDGQPVTWRINSATKATITNSPPPGGAEFEDGDMFYVPGNAPSGQAFSLDEITATSVSGKSAVGYVLVVEKTLSGNILMRNDPGLPAGKVQFEMFNGEAGPLPGVEWKVVAGGGTIDQDGVYTFDEGSLHRFTVITGFLDAGPFGQFNAYMILPVPLIDLDEATRILS